jgi:hypothetical protein
MAQKLQWEIYVSIFKNKYILRGLALAIGLPFGLLIAILLIVSGGDLSRDAGYALGLIIALLVLTALFVLIIYGGRYAPGFIIDETGVTNYTQAKQQKKNKIINGLAVALGLMSGSLTAAGAGMMAASRQTMHIKWKNIRKVSFDDKRRVIMLRGGFAEKIAVFCTQENYAAAKAMVEERTKRA